MKEHKYSLKELEENFEVRLTDGLKDDEAEKRLTQFHKNKVTKDN